MDVQEILKTVDHTLLKQDAVWDQIKTLCDEGMRYATASVCIAPCFVARTSSYLAGRLPVCTVIGFPNGAATTAAKCFEARDAVKNGAAELDMVINIGWAKEGRWEDLRDEISAVKEACAGRLLKVIIETCLLTQEEKTALCGVVSDSGADFIKTSTGFGGGGATFEDVALMKAHVRPGLGIKAAGGIAGLADAARFLELGADRLGTSRIVRAVQALEKQDTERD